MASAADKTVLGALLWLSLLAPSLDSSPHCDHYGGCRNYPFLPAPPGHTPSCAKPGQTYCEKIEHYPTQLVRYLIEQWGYDYTTLLSDESRDDFNYSRKQAEAALHGVARPPAPYGPPHPHRGYTYGPPKLAVGVPLSYYPLQLIAPPPPPPPPPLPPPAPGPGPGPGPNPAGNSSSGGGSGGGGGGGYPDRRYKLPPHQQHFLSAPYLYTTLLQPTAAVSHYNPNEWWTRYARSNSKVEGSIGANQTPARPRRNRRQSDDGPNQLCPTTRRFIMPKAAMNNQGNWMYVVNLNEVDDRYTQLVGTETCVSNRCNGICSIPNGFTSRCEQQYVQKRLVALQGSGNQLYTEIFWFPHCCVCQITQNV